MPYFSNIVVPLLQWSSYSITKKPNSKFWKIGPTLIRYFSLLFPFCFQKLLMRRKWNLILLSKKPNWVLKIHRGALSNSVKGQLTKIANHIWKPSSLRLADYGKNQGHFKGGPPLWVVGYEADSNFLHGSTLLFGARGALLLVYSEPCAAIFF